MPYSKRIRTICSLLSPCKLFADVGCDHGYCTEYMLKKGLCERAIFSDVSKGSLAKAEKLLCSYVQEGKATPVLGDGFFGVPKDADEVLIAGMGGSEIVGIISDKKYGFLPETFVFQPMHDSEKLRRYLIENGGIIQRDFTFEDGKFYDVIVGRKKRADEKAQAYTNAEYEFGKENLSEMNESFKKRLNRFLKDVDKYLLAPNLQQENKEELLRRKERLQGVLNGEIK